MQSKLEELKKKLQETVQTSGQSSYERRMPSQATISTLENIRISLIHHLEVNEPSELVWRLLAQAEECLLHYSAAKRCLERAMSFNRIKNKKDMKKLALYRQYDEKWKSLILTSSQLQDLGDFLERKLREAPFERGYKITRMWLAKNGISNTADVLESLRKNGGYNDFEILANVVNG